MSQTVTLTIFGQVNDSNYRLGTIEVPSKVGRNEMGVLVDIDQKEFKRRIEAFCAAVLVPHTLLDTP